VKSVAREMVERQAAFSGYVKELHLERIEGVLLRYLSQAYRTLIQNVPTAARTPELDEVIAFLRALLARVDDSLVREWESLMAPQPDGEVKPVDISADPKVFKSRVRAEMQAIVRALARGDLEEAAGCVRARPGAWGPAEFETALAAFEADRGPLVYDGRTVGAYHTLVEADPPHRWRVRQRIFGRRDFEEEEPAGWSIDAVVDLRDDTNPAGVVVEVVGISE
jgi:hypothetical protein